MPQVEKLLIFLASPGDVPAERRSVEDVVAELNRTVASEKGIVIQVVRWENDAYPGYGIDAQAIINKQIAEMSRYALFVGIMWNRLGTPTPRAESGTVEEFERAVEAFAQKGQPDIWFYFRQAASSLNTQEQLEQRKKVLAFSQQVREKGMPWTYKSPNEFRDKFRTQIILWLNDRPQKTDGHTEGDISKEASTSQLPKKVDAWAELKEDIISKGGMIYRDHWKEANSLEELEFKQMLKGKWDKSLNYLTNGQYEAIVKLWKPLFDNPFFRVEHNEWQDKPYFRAQIHGAKCHLFIACAQLGQSDAWETYVPQAFQMLKEVLEGHPYSMKGGTHDRLPTDAARTQNLNYEDTLNFALNGFAIGVVRQ